MTKDKNRQQFSVQRIYVKDVSFEAPLGARAFTERQKPTINQEINTKIEAIQESRYEVTLTISVAAKVEEQTVFLVEIQQAGLFLISGITEERLPPVLNIACANILFPYAREAIDNLLVKGTFSPIMLAPINFEALYAQAMERQKPKEGSTEIH